MSWEDWGVTNWPHRMEQMENMSEQQIEDLEREVNRLKRQLADVEADYQSLEYELRKSQERQLANQDELEEIISYGCLATDTEKISQICNLLGRIR